MRPPPIGGGFVSVAFQHLIIEDGFNEAAADWRRIPHIYATPIYGAVLLQ